MKHLGGTRINELTTAQIQHAIHRLKEAGGQITKELKPLGSKTVRQIGSLLYTALADADRLGILKFPHPMANKRVVLPKLPKRRPTVLDTDRLRVLVDRARNTRLYPLMLLASVTGCRRGELLALEWSDLDESTSEINVSTSLEQTKAGLRIKSTNSERRLLLAGSSRRPGRRNHAESWIRWRQPAFPATKRPRRGSGTMPWRT